MLSLREEKTFAFSRSSTDPTARVLLKFDFKIISYMDPVVRKHLASSLRMLHSGETIRRSVIPKFNMTRDIEPMFASE